MTNATTLYYCHLHGKYISLSRVEMEDCMGNFMLETRCKQLEVIEWEI